MEYYKFLFKPFLRWYRGKWDDFNEKVDGFYFEIDFENELGLTRDEFIEKFIKPYQGYTLEQIARISMTQTSLSTKYLGNTTVFEAQPTNEIFINSMYWTLVNIVDLKLEGFKLSYDDFSDVILKFDYEENTPYKQCRYCGKPYFDKRGEKHKFGNNNLHLCHVEGCETGNTNPQGEYHKEGCCFLQWKRIKKNFNQKLDRITGRLKNNKLINNKERAIYEFIKFCEERFEYNKTLEYTLQTKDKPATKIIPFIPYEFEVVGTINESYYD